MRTLANEVPGKVLLLGVTRGLTDLDCDLTAIDRAETLFQSQWPGTTARRRAVVGDWLSPPFGAGTFATCVSDGAFNTLTYPDGVRSLLNATLPLLRPGGRFISRVYTSPDAAEAVDTIAQLTWEGRFKEFQSLKFRLGMAIAAANGSANIAVKAIHRAFETSFPDRDKLSAATGWSRAEINTIDLYAGTSIEYSFPTRRQILSTIPTGFCHGRFISTKPYELSEFYPILVAERR